jgi:hypothetical protein
MAGAAPASLPDSTVTSASLVPGGREVELKYQDLSGFSHRFKCELDFASAHREEMSYGYPSDGEVMLSILDRRMEEEIKRRMGDLAEFAGVKVTHERLDAVAPKYTIRWKYEIQPVRWSRNMPRRLRKEASNVDARIHADPHALGEKVFSDYLRERGFTYEKTGNEERGGINIDYKRLADRSRPLLAECYDRLVREAGSSSEEETIKLLLAVFQGMPFEFPPIEDEGTYTGEFWVPTQVIQKGRGDCDSKSVALCSLWQRPTGQIMLFRTDVSEAEFSRIPPEMRARKHVLLGIEAYPGYGQATVQVGLRHYVLCEAVGRGVFGKLPPGEHFFVAAPIAYLCMTDNC